MRALHFSSGVVQSLMNQQQPDALELEYTRRMAGFLLFQPRPEHIGMIGLGGGSLVKFCHRHLPESRITVAEINPHVIEMRALFQVPPDDARLQVHLMDGADLVRGARGDGFDVLLVDGFDGAGLPPQLCSQGFYDQCLAALRPDGVLVANLHCADPDYAGQLARLRRRFRQVVVVGDPEQCNGIAFAAASSLCGRLRPPLELEPDAWRQLAQALARVEQAFAAHCGRAALHPAATSLR